MRRSARGLERSTSRSSRRRAGRGEERCEEGEERARERGRTERGVGEEERLLELVHEHARRRRLDLYERVADAVWEKRKVHVAVQDRRRDRADRTRAAVLLVGRRRRPTCGVGAQADPTEERASRPRDAEEEEGERAADRDVDRYFDGRKDGDGDGDTKDESLGRRHLPKGIDLWRRGDEVEDGMDCEEEEGRSTEGSRGRKDSSRRRRTNDGGECSIRYPVKRVC